MNRSHTMYTSYNVYIVQCITSYNVQLYSVYIISKNARFVFQSTGTFSVFPILCFLCPGQGQIGVPNLVLFD